MSRLDRELEALLLFEERRPRELTREQTDRAWLLALRHLRVMPFATADAAVDLGIGFVVGTSRRDA